MITKVQNSLLAISDSSVLRRFVLRHRLFLIMLTQLFIVVFSYFVSFYIRFEFEVPYKYLLIFYKTLPFLLISRMAAYYFFKVHSGSWLFVSMQDLTATLKAVFLGSILFLIMMVFIYRLEEFPRSVLILEPLLNIILIGGSRFMTRNYHEFKNRQTPKKVKYGLIAGAGKSGVLILKEIRTNSNWGIKIIGFVDDNLYKKGINIQGVPVIGSTEDIPRLVEELSIDEVIITLPSSGYKNIMRIVKIVRSAKVKVRVLPGLDKLIRDDTVMNQIRHVSCDDLLGRKALKFSRESDYKLIDNEVKGKTVLITGAGGSIGSELSRQVAQLKPRNLILYERHESSLYDIEIELKKDFPDQRIMPVIGDILDQEKLDERLKANNVDIIYHAAAYKHVPMMEREPLEAVRNNIIGTNNVANLAIANNVEKFILISTDKAVNPANVMGTTKRVAELIIQNLNGNGTKFVAVRFGNVIGSAGSVIPLFQKQIADGGPITVTDPEVSRYFMSIPEAVQLVMIAGAIGNGREIFLLDMGEPIKIVELAKELIRFSGFKPGKDIEIVYTGLRLGEKLHEELYWQGEGIIPTQNKKITMLSLNGNISEKSLYQADVFEKHIARGDIKETLRLLKEIVPESSIRI